MILPLVPDKIESPPPVIFLTVINVDFPGIKDRIEEITLEWAAKKPVDKKVAKVEWISKWDLKLEETLTKIFEKWGYYGK